MTCNAETCENPTDRYICNECVKELEHAMSMIPDLLPILAMITRREEQPFTVRSERAGAKPGPQAAINLSSHAIWQNLVRATTMTPDQYAADPDGAWSKWYIEDQVTKANIMVHGEQEQTMTEDYILYRASQIQPMPSRLISEWLQEHMSLNIPDGRIRKWAERGQLLRANNDTKHPVYRVEDVLAIHMKTDTLRTIKAKAG